MLITQDAAEAEEAAQDAFVKAWRALRRFRRRRAAAAVAADDRRQRGAQPAPLGRRAGRALALRAAEPDASRTAPPRRRCSRPSRARALLGALSRPARRRPARARLPLPAGALRGRDRGRARRPAGHREVAHVARARAPARGGDSRERPRTALRELDVEWPATPDLAAAVSARLGARAARRRRGRAGALRLAYVAAALALLFGGTMAVSPDARSTVLRWLGHQERRDQAREPTAPAAGRAHARPRATLDQLRAARGAGRCCPAASATRTRSTRLRCRTARSAASLVYADGADPRADVPRQRHAVHREDDRHRRATSSA